MATLFPLVGFYHPPLPKILSLSHPLWCLPVSSCLILHLYLFLVKICLTYEVIQREVPFVTIMESPCPEGTLPPSLVRTTPLLRLLLSPHQTKPTFHLCPHHGISMSNSSISKGSTLLASLLEHSLTWPRPRSQNWHAPPIHHPYLHRHPCFQPLCLHWKIVTHTQKNSN
jgi:hypothetical protein